MNWKKVDWLILGAGIYGLYAALRLAKKGLEVLLVERDPEPFSRASYVNQARIHLGYHYPRSYSTATKSASYYQRFNRDFHFAINHTFQKIYAIAAKHSYTNAEQFEQFCRHAGIPCKLIESDAWFTEGQVTQAFETEEYAFDAVAIKAWFMDQLKHQHNVQIALGDYVEQVANNGQTFDLRLKSGAAVLAGTVLNATYASTNQIAHQFGLPKFGLKYEICEVALCHAREYAGVGITVMDGPFFSLMPFGSSGLHSLTSVGYTPHRTSHLELPTFSCQDLNPQCSPLGLANCHSCKFRPNSAWREMLQTAKKYLVKTDQMFWRESLFAIKPILAASEVDDSRPTVIRQLSDRPRFLSVLSGKINTIYDLDVYLR